MPNVKISLRRVCKVFDPGQGAALDDVSLDIAEGAVCVLMGLSGSGKSTLLRTINGLTPPSSGQVLIDGVDLAALAPRRLQGLRRDAMGMVFQSSALFAHRSVIDNAAFGLEIAGVTRAERHRRAGAVLEQVGLAAHAKQYPHQLSGGMRQRVGLARALAVDPSLLLMDEAFSALDPLKRRAMQELLLALQRERRRTIVFVSHDIDEALRLGQQIAILHGGRLLQQGTPRQLLASPADAHVRAFFDSADTSAHLQAADLIDHEHAPGQGGVAAAGPAHASVAADTRLSELMPRLSAYRSPLTVRDATGAALGWITAASALRIISRASARG
ncbi:MAG: ATP-binding cassette domain-containing protein [Pseudomonadota bacterium]